MSTVIFRHELHDSYKDKNGEKFTVKETIIDGAKGLSFMYLSKPGSKKFYRVIVKEEEPDTFVVREKEGEEEKPEKKMNMADVLKFISKGDEFKFIRDYIKNDRDNYRKALKGGRKKRSSKKSSKKRSSKKKMTGGRSKKRSSKKSSKKRSSKKKMTGGRSKKRSSKKSSKKRSSKKKMTGGRKKRSSKKRSSKKKMTGGRKKRSSKKSSKKRSSKKRMLKGFNTHLFYTREDLK